MSLLLALQSAGGNATANPPGVSATSALGSASATGAANVTAAGVAATSALGSATGSGAGIATGTGVSASTALGTSTATGAGNTTATGQSTTASIGTTTGRGDANTTATGVSATVSLGTATASGSSAVNGDAFPAGVSATASLGVATGTGTANTTATGAGTAASLGTASATGNAAGSTSGVAATASVGSTTPQGDANTTATGVSATVSLGTATASSGTGVDGNAYPLPLDLVTTNWGTPWADGGRRPKRDRLKLSKDAEAYPQGVEAVVAQGHAAGSGEIIIPWVPPPMDGVATVYGVEARARLGRPEQAGSASASACLPTVNAATGAVCPCADGQAVVIGIPMSSAAGAASASVHVMAMPQFDEGCESFVGEVSVLAVQNPTDEELAVLAQMLLNSQPFSTRSRYVR